MSLNFPITAYGARPDGSKCTTAVAAAVAAATAAGGGRVVVPPGTWVTGPVHLASHVELHLAEGADLVFTDEVADYLPAVPVSWEGIECYALSPLVYAYGAEDVAITGKGFLRPRLAFWQNWRGVRKPACQRVVEQLNRWAEEDVPVAARRVTDEPGAELRPHLIHFNRCRHVRFEDFSVRGSPFWTLHVYRCEDVVARGLDLSAWDDAGSPPLNNTDGIDIESSRRVLIEKCAFRQNDDVVVVKSGRGPDDRRHPAPCEDVLVRDCLVHGGHVMLSVGSELAGGVRRVAMENCRADGPVLRVLFLKTTRTRGGYAEDIRMENVVADEVRTDVFGIVALVGDFGKAGPPVPGIPITRFENVVMRNVSCRAARRLVGIEGDPLLPARRIRVEGVRAGRTEQDPVYAVNAEDIEVNGAHIAIAPSAPLNDPHW